MTIRMGAGTPRGYSRADLEDQWRRYLPAPSDNSKTSKTNETLPDKAVVDVAVVLDISAKGGEGGRCDQCNQRGNVMECHYGSASAWLHRECMDAWRIASDRSAGDGLEIPGFLDRRQEIKRCLDQ